MIDEREEEEIEAAAAEQVVDEAANDDTLARETFDITSYGADYDVEGLVKRLERGDVLIPSFQRDYVWTQKEASRFVESLLLGLPVPGVFFAKEASNKLLVIDGQQRLKTLQFFYGGSFNPKPADQTRRVFTLLRVQPQFEGLTYETLPSEHRVKLNDAIIHATIVRQESPAGDDTSIYYIFERLNNGGRRLTPQEIRVAIYHGRLIDRVRELNDDEVWRAIYGRESPRLKDQELILRYLAFLVDAAEYERPMTEFINKFASRHRDPPETDLRHWQDAFRTTVHLLRDAIEYNLFKLERTINAAVFDSVMIGVTRRLRERPIVDLHRLKAAYDALLRDPRYEEAVSRSTADDRFVNRRLTLATEAFALVP